MTAALTTTGIGLFPAHPKVYALTVQYDGQHPLTVYSLTPPTLGDDGRFDITRIPDVSFRPGYGNPRLAAVEGRAIIAYDIIEVPPSAATGERIGRPVALSNTELRDLCREHALPLADRIGPIGFPREAPGGNPGWSQTHLVSLVKADPRCTSGSDRLRAMCKAVLAEVKEEWLSTHVTPTAAHATPTLPPPSLGDPLAEALLADLLDPDARNERILAGAPQVDPDAWRPVLALWAAALHDDGHASYKEAVPTVQGWLTGWPDIIPLLRLLAQVWPAA